MLSDAVSNSEVVELPPALELKRLEGKVFVVKDSTIIFLVIPSYHIHKRGCIPLESCLSHKCSFSFVLRAIIVKIKQK